MRIRLSFAAIRPFFGVHLVDSAADRGLYLLLLLFSLSNSQRLTRRIATVYPSVLSSLLRILFKIVCVIFENTSETFSPVRAETS
jgi:hypothetical protein